MNHVSSGNFMRDESLTYLELLSALGHALSHKVRTPLSIISNDLFYLQSLVPSGECERAIKRCHEISAALQQVTLGAESQSLVERIDVRSVLGLSEGPEDEPKLYVAGPAEHFENLGRLLKSLLDHTKHGPMADGAQSSRMAVRCEGEEVQILFEQPVAPEFPEGSERSLTRLFFYRAGIDQPEPMLIDAITHHCGGTVSVTCTSGMVRGRLSFPLVDHD